MKNFLLLALSLTSYFSHSQTGVIKGKIFDKQSESPLIGATIELLIESPSGVVTDEDGFFAINNVPLGRQSIKVSYIGYESTVISELEITSGKDIILNIGLIESYNTLDEIVITASSRSKSKAINTMAAVSVRQFTTEEVTRYAGGRSDVARLASNFAGVSTADDSRNDIVIRGNSPSGLLWRIEGVPVSSPNHFSTLGTTGSPVSALNPNVLANSDFLTSAFPAEYGNAIGGVFDLSFRKGNKDDYEFMAGVAAFPGAEFVAEGPLLRKNGGSFLVAARYGIAGSLGLAGTSALPNYNDISFNLDFGKFKLGNFSLFGITGNSDIDFLGKDIDDTDLFAAADADAFVTSNFYSFGLKHVLDIGTKSYLKTIVSTSSSAETYKENRYFDFQTPQQNILRYTDTDNSEQRFTISTLFNSKISKKFTVRSGLLFENYALDANLKDREEQPDLDGDGYPDLNVFLNTKGSYSIFQPYAQGQYRLSEKLTLNAGLHGQYFSINEQFVLEPRTALTYAINTKNSVNIGYGLHHQNVAAPLLFLNENVNGILIQTNRDLDLIQSQHFVLGYDLRLADKWRAKAEIYYQAIDKAAVEKSPTSYSSLTEGADFVFSRDKTSLVSNGTGSNQGIEFTLEKFFSKGYHGLLTTSFFDSKYKGSDGIERNSPFNNGYVINVLGGKEFVIGKAQKNIFSINTKFTTAGGRYYTPVDLASSIAAGYQITDNSRAFSEQYDAYLRLDLKFGFKFNSKTKKKSHQFYIDFQNITDNKNIFANQYNRLTQSVNRIDQIGFQPDFGYRFQF
ncbi:TonB-dependent receptor [Yeosuana sp.]|uniref:TonB-dependent receptor n=1 Tax=Yeosuana sp. TaxID=2529388 RepID=UPI00404AF9B3